MKLTTSLFSAAKPSTTRAASHNAVGVELKSRGDIAGAIQQYEQAINLDPGLAEAHYNLGLACCELRQFPRAAQCFQTAARLSPHTGAIHFALGHALMQMGDLPGAESSYRDALAVQPSCVATLVNLAYVIKQQRRLEEAAELYRQALRLDPECAQAHTNLGNTLRELGQLEAAIAHHKQARQRMPDSPQVHLNMGLALAAQGRFREAIASYQAAIQLKPDYPEAHDNLGTALVADHQLERAAAHYEQALHFHPGYSAARLNLSHVYKRLGRWHEALDQLQWLVEHRPEEPMHELRLATSWPLVFASREELQQHRERLVQVTQRLQKTHIKLNEWLLLTSTPPPPFELQFLDGNLRDLKESYAAVFQDHMPNVPLPRRRGKPRVGIVVTGGHEGIFRRSLRGMLRRLGNARFDVVVVCAQSGSSTLRLALPGTPLLPLPDRFDQMVRHLAAAHFDVLYYWEIGTDATNYFLPFVRLAPIQCTSWGVQLTSGIPTVDYYLSSRLLEPADAQQHYSEQLLLGETLLTCQERVQLPHSPKTREQLGLPGGAVIYLCAQNLGKFHPDFDATLAAILRLDEHGIVAIPRDRDGVAWRRLQARIRVNHAEIADRIQFLPWLSREDYLSLVVASDVLLDPPHFGGVNTTYDGLSLGKPIVTWPSPYHRGRYTYACYQKMGLGDCVAHDNDDYVRRAVHLGADAAYREQVSASILRCVGGLFGDAAAAREHEQIFLQLIEQSRSQ